MLPVDVAPEALLLLPPMPPDPPMPVPPVPPPPPLPPAPPVHAVLRRLKPMADILSRISFFIALRVSGHDTQTRGTLFNFV